MLRSKKAYYFANGLLIGLILYFFTEDQYERQLFSALANNINAKLQPSARNNKDSIAIQALHMVHLLEDSRHDAFSKMKLSGFKARYLQPVTFDLMTGNGACGSNSMVLTRLLMEYDIPVRIGQMKTEGTYGGHIVVEAKLDNDWCVLDPLYNLTFRDANGQLASFSDVSNNWAYYSSQLPLNYDSRYNYKDVRYTNWEKVPLVMPAVHKLLSLVKGEAWADHISLRTLFVRKFRFFLFLTVFLYVCLLSSTLKPWKRTRAKAGISGSALKVA